jgi:PAS domain S-box-containing protein
LNKINGGMKYFHKKVWLGFITAITILTWLAITSYTNNKKSEAMSRWVAHTNRVLYHSEQILGLTVDLEAGQRGYALTGLKDFLKPVNNSTTRLYQHLEKLKQLISDNRSQVQRIERLKALVKKKMEFTMEAIEVRDREGLNGVIAMNATMEGKNLMDEIRSEIKAIQDEEHELLQERTTLTQKRVDDFNAAFAGMLLATAVILISVFYMIYISLKRRTEAEASLRIASETIRDIYDNAPCGYHSIDSNGLFLEINNTWLEWLKYTRDEVVNKMRFQQILTEKSLEDFKESFSRFQEQGRINNLVFDVIRKDGSIFSVLINAIAIYDAQGNFKKSRSTVLDYTEQKKSLEKIQQLNQELESFSYSVSHDLRAPLRSIDGYTQILLEDYAYNLDAEGKRVLNVVVNNARRMAKLIDDLLDFSRVGRKEVTKSVVNTESLVRSVISELRPQEGERDIDITIAPLDPCEADPNLLRQVWTNLISNALKYSRKKPKSEIEISSRKGAGEIIYQVRDNGTGFDMQYAHKLFGVFQRLHRQQEFEGTGVGLAIVHRIVSRHGGKVWAEGEADKGASFYFSLPNSLV